MRIAIVGGGIAGLYAAFELLRHNLVTADKMDIFESSTRWGGRILTKRIDKHGNEVIANVERNLLSYTNPGAEGRNADEAIEGEFNNIDLDFCAEFGPMRIEPDQQVLLNALLNQIGIRKAGINVDRTQERKKIHLIDFPAYSSPPSDYEPRYQLDPDEAAQDGPWDLLRLGLVRILGRIQVDGLSREQRNRVEVLDRLYAKTYQTLCSIEFRHLRELWERNGERIQLNSRKMAVTRQYSAQVSDALAAARIAMWDSLNINDLYEREQDFDKELSEINKEHRSKAALSLYEEELIAFIRGFLDEGTLFLEVDTTDGANESFEHSTTFLKFQEKFEVLRLLRNQLKQLSRSFDLSAASRDDLRPELGQKLQDLVTRLTVARATHQGDWKESFQHWIDSLSENDYQNFREFAVIDGVPLYMMGFWNLLSDVLSHNAVVKLRDLGKFYHLLPENPNAVEWGLLFSLRALKTSEKLQGIHGGMECIIDKLRQRILAQGFSQERFRRNTRITRLLQKEDGKLQLYFEEFDSAGRKLQSERQTDDDYDHVILALPKAALEQVLIRTQDKLPKKVLSAIDDVFGFPLVKTFVIVHKRWWEEKERANLYASHVPTRELHYWKPLDEKSEKGMVMVYTDRPASAFWPNYVLQPGRQDEPEWGKPIDNPRLTEKLAKYIRMNGVKGFRSEDIEFYGIRDWGRAPVVGACHSWRPERKSWQTMHTLSSFNFEGRSREKGSMHVCGEAYSDYQGFIEGSLRSVQLVLFRIFEQRLLDLLTGETRPPLTEDQRTEFIKWLRRIAPDVIR